MKSNASKLGAGLCVGLFCHSGWAYQSLYNDTLAAGAAAFDATVASLGGSVRLDSLSGLSDGTSWVRPGYTITATDQGARLVTTGAGLNGEAISALPTVANPQVNGLTFTFAQPVNAFGIEVADWASGFWPGHLLVSLDGGAPVPLATALSELDNPGYAQQQVYANFVGLIDAGKQYKVITIYNVDSNGADPYKHDLVYFGGTLRTALLLGLPAALPTLPAGVGLPVHNGLGQAGMAAQNIFNILNSQLGGNYRFTAHTPSNFDQSAARLDTLIGLANAFGNGGDRTRRFLSDLTAWQLDQSSPSLADGYGLGADANGSSFDLFRADDLRGSLAVRYRIGEHDAVGNANAYDYSGYSATFGLDTSLGERGLVGVGVAYGGERSHTTDTPDRADTDSTVWSLLAYGNLPVNDWANLDAVASYGWSRHDLDRTVGATRLRASPDGNETLVALRLNAAFDDAGWRHGPFGSAQYAETTVDAYRESGIGGLSVDTQRARSLIGQVGYLVATERETPAGVRFVPQLRVSLEHEFKETGRLLTVGPVGGATSALRLASDDSGWQGRLDLGLGVNFADPRRSLRFDYEILGNSDFMEQALTARFRSQF